MPCATHTAVPYLSVPYSEVHSFNGCIGDTVITCLFGEGSSFLGLVGLSDATVDSESVEGDKPVESDAVIGWEVYNLTYTW